MCEKCRANGGESPAQRMYRESPHFRNLVDAASKLAAHLINQGNLMAWGATLAVLQPAMDMVAQVLISCAPQNENVSVDQILRMLDAQVKQRIAADAERDRCERSGEQLDGVVEIINDLVVGTGGKRLPPGVVQQLREQGIRIPPEFL